MARENESDTAGVTPMWHTTWADDASDSSGVERSAADEQVEAALMKKLRARGIHLAMDDFGTGYSSLAYLKQFPLNTLKIDKAFIDDMNTARGRNMVDTIMTIAHNLSLSVVAEGVEQEEQLAMLRKLRCDVIQGYYYSKPLSNAEFTQFLQEQKARRIKLSAVPV